MEKSPSSSQIPPGLKLVLMAICLWFTWGTLTRQWQMSWLHNLHLPIHEAGHLLFSPFGEFIHFLGGSLFQVLFPLVFTGSFLLRYDWFAVALTLLWVGESIVNVSYYIGDAYRQQMPLIGGEHDWAYLLGELDWVHHADFLAGLTFGFGGFVMISGLCLGIWQTFKEGKFITIKH